MSERSGIVLIASNTLDAPNVDPVARLLRKKGLSVVKYQADQVAKGTVSFSTFLDSRGCQFVYNGRRLDQGRVVGAWYRRPCAFGPLFKTEDRSARMCLDYETAAAQQALWDVIPEGRWLNGPSKINYASHKITQLEMAQSLGFAVPPTVVSNQWSDITTTLPMGSVAFKLFKEEMLCYSSGTMKKLFTTVLSNTKQGALTKGLPYPGIWQTYIHKVREWRITVVGSRTFDVAIYTTKDAKDDWRLHQHDGCKQVEFAHERFPEAEKAKCLALLKAYCLRFGAFDFIEQPDGNIVFLEMNPNGQFMWLEHELGLPISDAIADELITISKN